MSYPQQVWQQLKNLTADDLIRALERDGWLLDRTRGAVQVYRHEDGRRVAVHHHPGKTYGPGLLRALLEDIGWSIADLVASHKWWKLAGDILALRVPSCQLLTQMRPCQALPR